MRRLIVLVVAVALVWGFQQPARSADGSYHTYLPVVEKRDAPVEPTPTATLANPTPEPTARPACDPSYPDVCIPPPPPDLNCADIPYRRFRVLLSDPHQFDTDHDGVGCESG